jgi:hypothetical protein
MATDLRTSFAHPGFQVSPGFDAAPNPKKENQEGQDFGIEDKTGNQTAKREQDEGNANHQMPFGCLWVDFHVFDSCIDRYEWPNATKCRMFFYKPDFCCS